VLSFAGPEDPWAKHVSGGAVADHDIAITRVTSGLLANIIKVGAAFFLMSACNTGDKLATENHQCHVSWINQGWTFFDTSLFHRQQALRAARPVAIIFIEIWRDMVRRWDAPHTFLRGGCNAPLGAPTSAKGIY
jgi:hypothetical protein